MPAKVLDGRLLARRREAQLKAEVEALAGELGRPPCLAVILVGDDEASHVYVQRKQSACERVGIDSREHKLAADTPEATVLGLVHSLNDDASVDGILVQLPLPPHIHKGRVLMAIDPAKDVDAFHPESVGHALIGNETMAPCTPAGILHLLDDAGLDMKGKDVVIINHSNLIGKPLAALLINRNATVTVCHKDTKDLYAHTRAADVVVTATGIADLLRAEHIKEGAVVIDVSIIRTADGTLRGDASNDVWDKASWVTPVPGGVGPMTISVLLENTIRAWKRA